MRILYRLLDIGTLPTMRHSEVKRMHIFNMSLYAGFLICLFLISVFYFYGVTQVIPALVTSLIAYAITLVIHSKRRLRIARLSAVLITSLLTFYTSIITKGSANFELFYITTILLIFVASETEEHHFPYSIFIPVLFYLVGETEFSRSLFAQVILPPNLILLRGTVITFNLAVISIVIYMYIKETIRYEKERDKYLEILNNNIKNQIHQHKLASLGEMATSISHEINNPLTIILGKASILKMHIAAEEYDLDNFDKILTSIEEASLRISHIIKSLQTYAKHSEHEEFSWYNLSNISKDCELLLKRKFTRQVLHLQNEVPTDLMLFCRESQFMQAMFNLLKICSTNTHKDNSSIHLTAHKVKEEVVITFKNMGASEPWNLEERALDSMQMQENQIAYAVASQIIEEHQGKLVMTHSPENTFTVHIPLPNTET